MSGWLLRSRQLPALGILLAAFAIPGCGDDSPTAATTGVEPFAYGTPARFSGGEMPTYAGRWVGQTLRVDCRSDPPTSCTRDFGSPRPEPLSVELVQDGATLSGTMLFGGQSLPFAGYVTTDRGVAGTSPLTFGGVAVVRFTPAGGALNGAVYSETSNASGQLIATRQFDIVTPLTRP